MVGGGEVVIRNYLFDCFLWFWRGLERFLGIVGSKDGFSFIR